MDSNFKDSHDKKQQDQSLPRETTPAMPTMTGLPTRSMAFDQLSYPSRDRTYFSQLYNQPLVTTLTSFSHVANLVRNPYELINNVDEFVKQASGHRNKQARTSENFAKMLNQNRHSSTPTSPITQEMDTFVSDPLGQQSPSTSSPSAENKMKHINNYEIPANQLPIPVLPPIESSTKRGRLKPLTVEEYENNYRELATDIELIERVFYGSMACNQLRAALWPYLFGLIKYRGKFEKIFGPQGKEAYLFIEDENNLIRWKELQELYSVYETQWKAILPDQEMRFSAFRERKSLIERDVIRCDRLHPFYAEKPENLAALTNLLMTYMMYDFDIGYVQGMSDLAGPILYMYSGDLVKAFWVFVEVMKLFRRNFELTQKTIHFQLNCLHELIKNTDPIFAQYLEEHESSNCFFAFRAIVCQFKRELMKDEEDDYSGVLFLWDTIWCIKRRHTLLEELNGLIGSDGAETGEKDPSTSKVESESSKPITFQPTQSEDSPFYSYFDPNQTDTPRYKLTETEMFVLALCLSMIRRERDIIMANKLDGTDIHLHFIDPKLATDLNGFIEHSINIYSFIENDFDITKLTSPKEPLKPQEVACDSPQDSAEGYDLLNDFAIEYA